jgi:hypothetical protein
MNGESSQQKWDRLQREYKQEVQAPYPNPKRRGCPGTDVLRELAARSARFEDQQWRRVIHCAPCCQQYLELRESCRLADKASVHRESR